MQMINILQVTAPITLGGAEKIILSINNLIDKSRFDLSFCIFINAKRKENEFKERLEELKCDISIIYMHSKYDIRNIISLIKNINSKICKIH